MKKLIAVIGLFIFMMCSSLYVNAEAININVYIANGYEAGYFLDDGASGYYYDYLNAIKSSDWKYEFKIGKPEALGSNDIVIGLTHGAFSYESEKPVVQDKYIAAFDPSNLLLMIDDLNSFYGKLMYYDPNELIGSQTVQQAFSEYLKANGINGGTGSSRREGKITYAATTQEPSSALESMSCDAYLMKSSEALSKGYVSGFSFTSLSRYIHTGSEAILDKIEENARSIEILEPDYFNNLYNRYFGALSTRSLSYSKEEKAYLSEAHAFTVGFVESYAPYSYVEDGVFKGLAIEYFNKITELSDSQLLFGFYSFETKDELEEAFARGDINIVGLTSNVIGSSSDAKTRSYYDEKISLFSLGNGIRRVVCFKQCVSFAHEAGYSDSEIVIVRNNDEFVNELSGGNVGGFFATKNHGNLLISANGISNVSVVKTFDSPIYFTVAANCDDTFISVLNKLTDSIDETYFDELATNIIASQALRNKVGEKTTLKDFVKKYSSVIFTTLSFVFAVIITLLVVILCIVLRQKKKNYYDLYVDEITNGPKYRKFLLDGAKIVKNNNKYFIVYLDIINFKSINTKFGVAKADEVLRCIYDRLKLVTRNLDVLCRKYADRFLLLLHYDDEEKMLLEVNSYGDMLYKYLMHVFPEFNLSFRAGVYLVKRNEDLDTACEYASEAALSLDKKAGVNVALYDNKLEESSLKKHEIESQMERALINEEFKVYYQPKVDSLKRELVGAEALVRWYHPEKGKMSPGQFIPLFEKNGFILKLDFYVFEKVCEYLAGEIKAGRKPVVISSNFSKLHLESSNFIEKIDSVVEKYDVPKEYIEIELTETMEPGSYEKLCEIVKVLYSRGYKISIDDFGSGNSSFQLIYDLPITTLKIDAVFVRNTDKSDLEEELMTSVISLCKNHNIHIVCEGVETDEELLYAQKHNCSVIQGYYYSKPLPLDEFMKYKVE